MEVEEAGDGAIVVTYDSSALTKVMLCMAALFIGVAGYDGLVGARGTERLLGLLASAATLAIVGVVFLETTSFRFAPATRTITWRRRWGFSRRAGELRFDQVQSVRAERPIGDDGTPSRRVVLRTDGGTDIPITVGYQTDPDGGAIRIADRIRAVLGHDADAGRTQDVGALVAAGRTVEAIRVLREEEGLSLTDAKRRVEELVQNRSGPG